mgnify:CR=1 FL=1
MVTLFSSSLRTESIWCFITSHCSTTFSRTSPIGENASKWADMKDGTSFQVLLPESPVVLGEGGEGRVQAERPTHTRPQGQGNGPEGERHTELDRSPCPGRRCPCGCPQQVDRLGHPLARGVARMAPGWLPTIMADPVQPCPQPDDTHQEYPRRKSGDMDPPAGTLRSSAAPAADRVALSLIRAISGGRM